MIKKSDEDEASAVTQTVCVCYSKGSGWS